MPPIAPQAQVGSSCLQLQRIQAQPPRATSRHKRLILRPTRHRVCTCQAQNNRDPDPARPPTATDAELEYWRRTGAYNYPPPPSNQGNRNGWPPGPPRGPEPEPPEQKPSPLNSLTTALVAAAFVTGLGAGVYFDSEVTLTPSNVVSTEIIDRATPDAELCMAEGFSAMVFDQRVFVSYNPFNVYVTQPTVKPGCVLRQANVGLLERKGLVKQDQVELCKRRMNTFGFVGDLSDKPEVACLYHSEEAENQYLANAMAKAQGGGQAASASTPK